MYALTNEAAIELATTGRLEKKLSQFLGELFGENVALASWFGTTQSRSEINTVLTDEILEAVFGNAEKLGLLSGVASFSATRCPNLTTGAITRAASKLPNLQRVDMGSNRDLTELLACTRLLPSFNEIDLIDERVCFIHLTVAPNSLTYDQTGWGWSKEPYKVGHPAGFIDDSRFALEAAILRDCGLGASVTDIKLSAETNSVTADLVAITLDLFPTLETIALNSNCAGSLDSLKYELRKKSNFKKLFLCSDGKTCVEVGLGQAPHRN